MKLTETQHKRVVQLPETIETELPEEGILDITLAIMTSLRDVAFMETSMSVNQLTESFNTWAIGRG